MGGDLDDRVAQPNRTRSRLLDGTPTDSGPRLGDNPSTANTAVKLDADNKRAVLEHLAGLDPVTYELESGAAARVLGLHPASVDRAVEAVRAEIATAAEKYLPPQIPWVTAEELDNARLAPRCIVEDYLWADLGLVVAPGGVGKTTLLIYEAVHIAMGMPLYGLRVKNHGPVAQSHGSVRPECIPACART